MSKKLRFLGGRGFNEYHGPEVDFTEIGEEKDVDEAEAQRLLTTFPHMFQLVDKRGRPPILRKEVERRFGKSIKELLQERKDKSVREIAKKFGVSKSLVAKWRKRYLAN